MKVTANTGGRGGLIRRTFTIRPADFVAFGAVTSTRVYLPAAPGFLADSWRAFSDGTEGAISFQIENENVGALMGAFDWKGGDVGSYSSGPMASGGLRYPLDVGRIALGISATDGMSLLNDPAVYPSAGITVDFFIVA